MGFDLYGENPIQKTSVKKFPIYAKYEDMPWGEREKRNLTKMKSFKAHTTINLASMKKLILDFILGTTVGGGDHCGTLFAKSVMIYLMIVIWKQEVGMMAK